MKSADNMFDKHRGRRTGAEIHVLIFDDGVRMKAKLTGIDWSRKIGTIRIKGGGGTSFVDVVDQAAKLDPSIIIILTDLLGVFGDAPKNIPVIWAILDDRPPFVPPFGRILSMAR
jgi:predicted metal-dependent peptidase